LRLRCTGTAGWISIVEPLLQAINPSISVMDPLETDPLREDPDQVIDLTKPIVLVDSSSLFLALQRLSSIVNLSPIPNLCRRVIDPILIQLWTLSSWADKNHETTNRYSTLARSLLNIYFKINFSADNIVSIIDHLLQNGERREDSNGWAFAPGTNSDIHIIKIKNSVDSENILGRVNLVELEKKAKILIETLLSSGTGDEISSLFLTLLEDWIKVNESENRPGIITDVLEHGPISSAKGIFRGFFLQQMMEMPPEKLISRLTQLWKLIHQVLNPKSLVSQPDDVIIVALSLLNLYITSPQFQTSQLESHELEEVQATLDKLSRENRPDLTQTARNLSALLKLRDDFGEELESKSAITDAQIEDRKTYNLSMTYITQTENPPPVRSEGLNMLSKMILSNSSILDIPAILVLLASIMEEDEDFLNLRAIKMYTELANRHPRAVTQELVERYLDSKEKASTDKRLRFGEALLQVIERLGETFTGEMAHHVAQVLLSIAGRRGDRPKARAKQEQQERLKNMKNAKGRNFVEEDDGETDMDITEEERANNEILAQIVHGWEGKRGSEDVRIRSSALSILARSIEGNITGVGATLTSDAVDLGINILTIEPELEKAILRRSAILLVLAFIKALHKAREAGRNIGFGLTDQSREDITRALTYIASIDNDGLVRQHADDVVESLANWNLSQFYTSTSETGSTLSSLSGLAVNPVTRIGASIEGGTRPKIEEID
jgi:hypothetical protein